MRAFLSFLLVLMLLGLVGCSMSPRRLDQLTPAEKVQFQQLENDYHAGKMDQADYDLQKAALLGSP